MEKDLTFINYSDKYENVLKEIEREIAEEKDITNITSFDKKSSKLVLDDGNVIGFVATLSSGGIPSIQYSVLRKYRRCGYGMMILNSLTDKCFEDGYDRVELSISPKNEASIKMAEKCGYYRNYDAEDEFNSYNSNNLYYTYYKNNYRKRR